MAVDYMLYYRLYPYIRVGYRSSAVHDSILAGWLKIASRTPISASHSERWAGEFVNKTFECPRCHENTFKGEKLV